MESTEGLDYYSNSTALQAGFSSLYCTKENELFYQTLRNTTQSTSVHVGTARPCHHGLDDVTMAEASIKDCDILLDLIWETINIGHWRDVIMFWRHLYRAVCYVKSVNLLLVDKYSDALLSCDMGIMMGAPIENELFIQKLADELVSNDIGKLQTCDYPQVTVVKSNIPIPILPNHKDISAYNVPSLGQFLELIDIGTPFIMKNVINHWPALKKWSPQYLLQNFGERTVPIEIGSSYTSESWSQKLVKLKEFINTYILSGSDDVAYLAQYELFNHITALKKDISMLDYCAVSETDVVTNCWFGPEGTVSPLHHDHYQNLFCQVYGYKRFIMFDRNDNMHAHQHHLLENTSQMDIESPNVVKDFPDYADKTAWVADLRPGDVLYLPLHWWHHVRSLSVSFSVSFWWKN